MAEIDLAKVLDGRREGGPEVEIGDTVKVHARVVEGGKERIQVFEGTVLRQHRPKRLDGTFTVRRVAHGVGVERTFLFASPRLDKQSTASGHAVAQRPVYPTRRWRLDPRREQGQAKSTKARGGQSLRRASESLLPGAARTSTGEIMTALRG